MYNACRGFAGRTHFFSELFAYHTEIQSSLKHQIFKQCYKLQPLLHGINGFYGSQLLFPCQRNYIDYSILM